MLDCPSKRGESFVCSFVRRRALSHWGAPHSTAGTRFAFERNYDAWCASRGEFGVALRVHDLLDRPSLLLPGTLLPLSCSAPSTLRRRRNRPATRWRRSAEPGTCPLRALEWPPAIALCAPASARKRHSARCPPCTHTLARSALNDRLARRAAVLFATLENGLLACDPQSDPAPLVHLPRTLDDSIGARSCAEPAPASEPFVLVRTTSKVSG